MEIQLDQIAFDFDPERSVKEPLSFIKDATKSTEAATSFKSEDFVVTYARSDRVVPEIKIELSCSDMNLSRAQVRGVPEKENVLGEIPAMWVKFERGKTAELTLSFPSSTLGTGVQCNTIGWEWQCRTNEAEEWIPFGTTRHRVCCIFANPTNPWDRVPFSEEVCEIACNWAQGAQSEIPAATNITNAVFNLGNQGTVIYSEIAKYAEAQLFDLEGFLSLLNNGVGTGQMLNCDDCATIVSTFGNILGCDLHQSEMRRSFSTNFVRLIGRRDFDQTGFERHAVAWKNACEANDPLYDACLQIDVDGKPNLPDHVARQPANIRFGSGSVDENEYRFCMVLSSTPCEPTPGHMIRRRFGKSYVGQRRNNDEPYLRNLKNRYNFDSVHDDERIGLITPRIPLPDFVKIHPAFDGWQILQVERFADRDLEAVDQIVLLLPEKDPRQMAELNVYICAEAASSKEFFLQLLAQSNSMEIQRAESALPGAIVFANPDQTTHFIKYHQLICLVRSVGKKPISTTTMAKALEDYFVRLQSGDEQLFGLTPSTTLTNDQLATGESTMTHKLAQIFTCHLGGNVSGLEERGHMNLTSMTTDGQLTNGIYYSPAGNRTLRGEAFGGNPVFFLILREFDGARLIATYDGHVVHESRDGSKLVLAGKRRAPGGGGGPNPAEGLTDQDDTPWVITKP